MSIIQEHFWAQCESKVSSKLESVVNEYMTILKFKLLTELHD